MNTCPVCCMALDAPYYRRDPKTGAILEVCCASAHDGVTLRSADVQFERDSRVRRWKGDRS